MLTKLKQLYTAYKLLDNNTAYVIDSNTLTPAELLTLRQSGKLTPVQQAVKPLGDGKAEFLPFMTEGEMMQHIKESELGWGKVYKQIKGIINGKG